MKIASVLVLCICCFSLFAQERKQYKTTTGEDIEITIDGHFDEKEWGTTQWEGQFIQHEPREGEAPHKQTEFALLYDANNIYVAIRSFDSPDSISMRMSRRDDLEGDLVGIYFDSYYDKRTAFGFIASAAGVRSDMINTSDGDREDDTWDPVWLVKTAKTKKGWNAEMKIPLTQLRFEEGDEQIWGLQVLRYIFRKDELSSWQPMKREEQGFASKFGLLTGIKDIKPQNALSVTPYTVLRTERFEKVAENPFLSDGKDNGFEAGLDAKIGLTNSLTMDLTINPDFGQVEADPSQVNLTTFETFFREKRPFFIEGKNIFSYGLSFGDGDMASNNLFYSRRIGRRPHYYPDLEDGEYADRPDFTKILGAAKVTGKTPNGWSVGVLESVTAEESAKIRSISNKRSMSVEPLTNYFVSRVQKDFDEGNTVIGGIITAVNRNLSDDHLEFLHKSAYTGGIDIIHRWKNKDWFIDGGVYFSKVNGTTEALIRTQRMFSRSYQRPDISYVTLDSTRTSLSGHGGKFTLGKVGGRFKFAAIFNWKSPGLEINDVGFSRSVDELFQAVWVGYRWYEPFSIFRNANINFNQWTSFDFGGHRKYIGSNINGHAQFTNFYGMFGSLNIGGEQRSNSILRGGPSLKTPGYFRFYGGMYSNNQKKFRFEADGGFSFSSEKGFDNWKSAEIELSYRPTQSLQFEISPEYTVANDKLQYITQEDFQQEKRYIMGTINRKTLSMSLRMNYNITPEFSIQFWGQPFIATGDYSNFKYITNSKASDINDRFRLFTSEQISYNANDEVYLIDETGNGTSDYQFNKPDFNVQEFLSNLVLRWEYRPGSLIYLVWSQNRSGFHNVGKFRFSNDLQELFDEKAHNVFLVKVSYRIGR